MIELFVFLFVLQGDTPSEWLESCNADFVNYAEKTSERDSDVLFCKYVKDLDLTVSDIEKLGKEFNWLNYAMTSTNEFIEGWEFYQENAIKDTLVIWPSISTRDSLPPAMKVQISFDYNDGSEIKKFDESFKIMIKPFEGIHSEDEWVISPPKESILDNDQTSDWFTGIAKESSVIEPSPLGWILIVLIGISITAGLFLFKRRN